MKFSQITFATLLLVLFLLFGAAGYFLYQDGQQAKEVCMKLSDKIANLEEQAIKPVEIYPNSNNCPLISTATSAQLWASLQKKIQNTVVQLFVQKAAFNWLEPYKVPEAGAAFGTGFFINDSGYVSLSNDWQHQ